MTKPDTQATGQEEVPEETNVSEDTTTHQHSEASESVVNEDPEATQGSEEQETPSETEVDTAEDTSQEQLYAGKYKTVEELESAYKNAESKLGQTTSEKAELARILGDSFETSQPSAEQQPKQAPEQRDSYEDYGYQESTPQSDPRIERIERDNAITKFIFGHPDADGSSMNEVLAKDPLVKQISGYEAKLEYAYLRSKNIGQGKAVKQAEKRSAEQTKAKIAEKQTARVESGRKSEPVDEEAELMSKAQGGNPSERKSAREKLIRKHLIQL